MDRAQIDRAERVADFAGQKRVLKQFRRMDYYDQVREKAKELLDNERREGNGVLERLRYYEDHAKRQEIERLRFIADSMAEGIIPNDEANRIAEFYKRDGKRPKRIPNTQKQFTDLQMAIAMRSLDKKPEPIEYGV